jgi:hypothetical protein
MAVTHTLTLSLLGRDLSAVTERDQPLLNIALDEMPLVHDHGMLADLVRGSVSPFAFRIEDDHRLVAVWGSWGKAAVVSSYWRRRAVWIDLMLASVFDQRALEGLPFLGTEIELIRTGVGPLLVRCQVGQTVPALAEILGLIAWMPVFGRSGESTNRFPAFN